MSLPIITPNATFTDAIFYLYQPSDVAAYSFIALFGSTAIAHAVPMMAYGSWHFIPLILGAILQALAYYGRVWSHSNPNSIGAWALCALLVYLAPVLLAATLYLALCRIIVAIDASEHSMISPRRLVKLYILVDILVFLSQLAGVGLQVTGNANIISIASKVIAGGQTFQLIMLLLFGLIGVKVQSGCRECYQEKKRSFHISQIQAASLKYFVPLYIGAVATGLRSLVRLIEVAQGPQGVIARHEAFQYVFDALPMLAMVVAFLVKHPGKLIRQARRTIGTTREI